MSDDLEKLVEVMKKNHRPHAGHFSWESDRDVEEYGVLKEVVDALSEQHSLHLTKPQLRGRGYDPPDCEATSEQFGTVAIELTELVHGKSIEVARLGGVPAFKSWDSDLVPVIQGRIKTKGVPKHLKGGPYGRYILVIYTDEQALSRLDVQRILKNHVFSHAGCITDAFLLISYCPHEKGYPCVRLDLAGT